MSEPEAIVARFTITPENLERWLDSEVPSLWTWDEDWQAWWDARREDMYGPSDRWDDLAVDRPGSVRDVVDGLVERSGYYQGTFGQTWYDAATRVWRLLAIEVSENYGEMIRWLAPFRAAERFGERDEEDYVAFTSYFWTRDTCCSGAAVRFAAGRSTMLLDHKLPKHVVRDIAQQFRQAEEDRIISSYRHPDGTPPDGIARVPNEGERA
jgi:hypothetical protein